MRLCCCLLLCAACPAAADLTTPSGVAYRVEVLASGLGVPAAVELLSPGVALVSDRKAARLLRVNLDKGTAGAVAGLPPVYTGEDAGLLDLLWDPGSEQLTFSYSTECPDGSTLAVAQAPFDGERLGPVEVLLSADACAPDRFHYGGALVRTAAGLFVTVGDRHQRDRAQDTGDHVGSVLLRTADGRVQVFTHGHRHPYGLAVHPETRVLWVSEHGPRGGDEVNVLAPGGNYGWPLHSWGLEYDGGAVGAGVPRAKGFERPVHNWSPAIAPSGLAFYEGAAFPAWSGSLLIGSLGRRHLNRTRYVDGRMVLEERIAVGDRRIRSLAVDGTGRVLLGADTGELLRLSPVPAASATTR